MRSSSGFTLIEIVVWIAVLTAALIALCSALVSFYHINSFAMKDAVAIGSAQHSMDTAVRAIRTAGYSQIGAYPVISIAANQISFYANVTKGSTNIEQVRFFTQGNSLYEGVIEPQGDPPAYTGTETLTDLSDYVLNTIVGTSTFFYYDQNGSLITNYTQFQNVRFVTVNLVVDVSTTSLPTQLTLTESAALRNLITH
jgi:type II secretory pathway pseudopilin PulG